MRAGAHTAFGLRRGAGGVGLIDFDAAAGCLDVTGAASVEVRVRGDGRVLWINTEGGLRLRVCAIEALTIVDERGRKRRRAAAELRAGAPT